jgi:hypothetical protein
MNRTFGWDLPPGCRISDIPGNRPSDEAEEAFWFAFSEKLHDAGIKSIETSTGSSDETVIALDDLWDNGHFVKLIETVRDMAYTQGFNEGQADAEITLVAKYSDAEEAFKAEQLNMTYAHADGLHADHPREFCPECEA